MRVCGDFGYANHFASVKVFARVFACVLSEVDPLAGVYVYAREFTGVLSYANAFACV